MIRIILYVHSHLKKGSMHDFTRSGSTFHPKKRTLTHPRDALNKNKVFLCGHEGEYINCNIWILGWPNEFQKNYVDNQIDDRNTNLSVGLGSGPSPDAQFYLMFRQLSPTHDCSLISLWFMLCNRAGSTFFTMFSSWWGSDVRLYTSTNDWKRSREKWMTVSLITPSMRPFEFK